MHKLRHLVPPPYATHVLPLRHTNQQLTFPSAERWWRSCLRPSPAARCRCRETDQNRILNQPSNEERNAEPDNPPAVPGGVPCRIRYGKTAGPDAPPNVRQPARNPTHPGLRFFDSHLSIGRHTSRNSRDERGRVRTTPRVRTTWAVS